MTTILFTLALFLLFFAMMAVGLLRNRELKGSCGGPKVLEDGSTTCCQDPSGTKSCDQVPEKG